MITKIKKRTKYLILYEQTYYTPAVTIINALYS